MNYFKYFILITLIIVGCNDPVFEIELEDISEEYIDIPDGFDYSTYRQVKVNIQDSKRVKYQIFAYEPTTISNALLTFEDSELGPDESNDKGKRTLDNLLFTGFTKNGTLEHTFNLPKFYDKLYILRNDNLHYSSTIEDIIEDKVNYSHTEASKHGQTTSNLHTNFTNRSQTTVVTDYLYGVNKDGDLFQIDPLTGIQTSISSMPEGSFTCAIDQENKMLYSIGKFDPYPLMRYSIENNTWTTIANFGQGGPRLDFNTSDNLLYYSKYSTLMSVDPSTGNVLNTWTINDLTNSSGGDLAFDSNGVLYMCTFGGLYRLDLDSNNEYYATRISADHLKRQLQSFLI